MEDPFRNIICPVGCLISIQANYPEFGFYTFLSVLNVVISSLQIIALLLNLKQYPVKIVKLLT